MSYVLLKFEHRCNALEQQVHEAKMTPKNNPEEIVSPHIFCVLFVLSVDSDDRESLSFGETGDTSIPLFNSLEFVKKIPFPPFFLQNIILHGVI